MDVEQHQQPQEQSPSTLEEWLSLPVGQVTTSDVMECLDPTASIFHEDYWVQGTRRDGRLLSQVRPTKVVYGVVKKHAVGSAVVSTTALSLSSHAGNFTGASTAATKVLAATTLQFGQPSPQTPDRGDVVVKLTINSTTSRRGASGGSGSTSASDGGIDLRTFQQEQHADVLQSWLQRMMEEDFRGGGGGGRHGSGSTKSIPSCLNILPGKFCLRLVVTVVVLEDGGSIKDACLLACMAAWKDTKLPVLGKDVKEVNGKMYWTDNWFHKNEINSDNDDGYISDDPSSNRMTVDSDDDNDGNDQRNFRVSLTMGVWVHPTNRTTFILDPSAAEEIRLGGDELTVTTEIGNEDNIQIEYAGRIPLTATDLAFISKLVKAHGEDVTKMLLC